MYCQSEEKQADCLSKNATNIISSLSIFASFGFARAELYISCKWSVRLRNCTVSSDNKAALPDNRDTVQCSKHQRNEVLFAKLHSVNVIAGQPHE